MAINPVKSSSPSAPQFQAARPQGRPQAVQSERTREEATASKPRQAQPAQARSPEPARPVVNAQGQTTGTRINTTA